MESDVVIPDGEFTPSIRRNIKLDDLSIREDPSNVMRPIMRPFTPLNRTSGDKFTLDSDGPRRNSLPGVFLHTRVDRPRLVDVNDFRNSVSAWVDSVNRGRSVQAAESQKAESTIGGIERLDASPLVRALRQSLVDGRKSRAFRSLPGTPLTPSINTPLEDPGFALEPPLREPIEDKLSERPVEKVALVLESPIPEALTSLRSGLKLPPLPVTNRHSSSRASSVSSPTVKQLPLQPESRRLPPSLTLNDTVRLVRILERIAARKILRAWRRSRRDPPSGKHRDGKTAETRQMERQMKAMMKDLALNALANSKLIREELASIRQGLSERPSQKAPIMRASSVVNFTQPPPMSVSPPFKSCRILIGPTVQSPVMMDQMIDDLTAGKGRNGVRLCVAQPTIHPRAFVIVIALNMLSVDEWLSRISNCFYVHAYDSAFPLFQLTTRGIPWEVKIRSDMLEISPNWVETGGSRIFIHNSGG